MSKRKRARAEDFLEMPISNPDQLHDWVQYYTELNIPRQNVCPHHMAPFEYLCKAYFEPGKDLVVWAPRHGGKTRLAAIATLLDLVQKPGCAVRILAGSLDQSLKMWEHLIPDIQKWAHKIRIEAGKSSRSLSLDNGSSVAALAQSQRAVRGMHVQKLRCDEVEMFRPEIWEAAQLAINSKPIERGRGKTSKGSAKELLRERNDKLRIPSTAPTLMRGSVEAISTHHKRGGVMEQIIDRAKENGTEIIQWCLLEVLEKCAEERKCETCPLWNDCKGIAKKKCNGFLRIDDAIRMKQRVSLEAWETEMMCHRPSTSMSVFPNFDQEIHVVKEVPSPQPSPRALGEGARGGLGDGQILAIDFGFHNPFVCLWIADDGVNVHVVDEYMQSGQPVDVHVQEIRLRGNAKRICCDPAGAGRNDQTAESNIQLLRRSGFKVYHKSSRIIEGLELIRTALRPAAGKATLFIHPRCKRLIKAMERLKFPDKGGELPFKDGEYDHPVDALRYFYVNRVNMKGAESRRY